MKITKLTFSLLTAFLLAGCNNGGGTTTAPAPAPSNTTSEAPKEGKDIELPDFTFMSNLEASKNYFFRYTGKTKTIEARYYDSLNDMRRSQRNESKSFEKVVDFVYAEGNIFNNSMMKFSHGGKDFFIYYTLEEGGGPYSKDKLFIRVEESNIFTESILYPNHADQYTIGGLNGLPGGYYYSEGKLTIQKSDESEIEAYIRTYMDGDARVKVEYSEEASFASPVLLDDFAPFPSLYASMARADNGLCLISHNWTSRGHSMTIQKKATDSSKSYIPKIELWDSK